MQRGIDIVIDANTWPQGAQPPPRLMALQGNQQFSVFDALSHIAVRTRPPVQLGFDLSDYWPWLRYFPALDTSFDLRLRSEWTDLDPHQKTILSDDFGVGLPSYFLTEALELTSMVNTEYFIDANPGTVALGASGGKRGPRKRPDYIAVDRYGRHHVIECKGTQASQEDQQDQLQKGIPQKANVSFTNAAVGESLVAGVFIPQFGSLEGARVKIIDPEESDEPLRITASGDEIIRSLTTIEIATSMNLAGMPALGAFSLGMDQRLPRRDEYIESEIRRQPILSPDGEETIGSTARIFFTPPSERESLPGNRIGIEVSVSMPIHTVDNIRSHRVSDSLVGDTRAARWQYRTHGDQRLVVTPTGLRFNFRIY